ncbi:MAG: metal ABC transporter ATP-binding protein [Victivallales bacterium]|jgi:zinc transport system ATP-binding protein|nr:metal ABC transporter ATP-binding protein [Victivallales bacterium]
MSYIDQTIVELSHVSFGYEPGILTLDDVSFQIERGRSGCIVGPNGGGKSTLLRLLLGLLSPQKGELKVFGKNPSAVRQRVGYMPQYHQLDAAFPVTVLEVVLMGRMHRGFFGRYNQADHQSAKKALDDMGIGELTARSFSELSGGQRQRVLIARALASDPELLLLDEPTANIDPGAEEQFYNTLNILRQRMTVLTVSHDLGFVNREIDLVICVNRKVTIHEAAAFSAETANEVYHHQVNLIKHDHACFCNCEHRQVNPKMKEAQ